VSDKKSWQPSLPHLAEPIRHAVSLDAPLFVLVGSVKGNKDWKH